MADLACSQAIIALSDTTNGVIILPTVLYLSRVLAKVALGLDKNPELVSNVQKDQTAGDLEGTAEKVTFVETSANVLREAFIKCLADKSGGGIGAGRRGKPENKRTGIYMTANSCLKLLFQCGKLRNAQQMFVSIDAQSPLLSYYPAAQRVTYLYYLGRYLFANNHFYRAQLALSSAYEQCHAQALSQRRLILIYLITSNICLGRFPSSKLLMRREAGNLHKRFLPLCRIIARGDLSEFQRYLSLESEHGQWFLRKHLLLQLRSRCEVLVWRSLVRKVFVLSGFLPEGDDNKMPFLRLSYVQAAAHWLERRTAVSATQILNPLFSQPRNGLSRSSLNGNSSDHHNRNDESTYVDPEFAGLDDAIAETGFDLYTGTYHNDDDKTTSTTGFGSDAGDATSTTAHGSTELNQHHSHDDADKEHTPTMDEIESIIASLLQQGLLHGFLLHTNPRFAIPGSKAGGGALRVGFPNIWRTIAARAAEDVPGWVRESSSGSTGAGSSAFGGAAGAAGSGGLGGRVVNLKGARPVGATGP